MLPEVKCLFLFSGPLYFVKQGGENYRVFLHSSCSFDGVPGR